MPVSKKEVCSLTHPPLQAQAVVMALRLAGGSREGDPTPQGAGAIPLCPRTSSIFSFDFSSFLFSLLDPLR